MGWKQSAVEKRLLIDCDVLSIGAEDVVTAGYNPVLDNERNRVLDDHEIRLLAHALGESGLSMYQRAALWIMLCTGTRVGETVSAEWSHIDLNAGIWQRQNRHRH